MEAEFFNIYVEKLVDELSELQKTKILLSAQVSWADKQLKELTELKNKIENGNNDLVTKQKEWDSKIASLQSEVDALRVERENLIQENSTAGQQIQSLNAELENAASNILDLEAQIAALSQTPKPAKKVKVKKEEITDAEILQE